MAPTKRSGEEFSVELDKRKRVTVRLFNGVNLVDIREFYVDKESGEKKPGKKGIALTQDVWQALLDAREEIDEALGALGGGKRAKREVKKVKEVKKEEATEQPEKEKEEKEDEEEKEKRSEDV